MMGDEVMRFMLVTTVDVGVCGECFELYPLLVCM